MYSQFFKIKELLKVELEEAKLTAELRSTCRGLNKDHTRLLAAYLSSVTQGYEPVTPRNQPARLVTDPRHLIRSSA